MSTGGSCSQLYNLGKEFWRPRTVGVESFDFGCVFGIIPPSFQIYSLHVSGKKLCPFPSLHLSLLMRSGIHTVFALDGKGAINILVHFTYMCINYVRRWCLSINNRGFENYMGQMYPVELDFKDTTESNTSAFTACQIIWCPFVFYDTPFFEQVSLFILGRYRVVVTRHQMICLGFTWICSCQSGDGQLFTSILWQTERFQFQ